MKRLKKECVHSEALAKEWARIPYAKASEIRQDLSPEALLRNNNAQIGSKKLETI